MHQQPPPYHTDVYFRKIVPVNEEGCWRNQMFVYSLLAKHPHPQIVEVYNTKSKSKYDIVDMEYMDTHKPNHRESSFLLNYVMKPALRHLHSLQIVYADVQWEQNIAWSPRHQCWKLFRFPFIGIVDDECDRRWFLEPENEKTYKKILKQHEDAVQSLYDIDHFICKDFERSIYCQKS